MSIADGPHYEISSSELADWIDRQAKDQYWMVEDDLMACRMPFPSPSPRVSAMLRRMNRSLLVQAPESDTNAKGQIIHASDLDALATLVTVNLHDIGEEPKWIEDREFYMCWKGNSQEWLLYEVSPTARNMRMGHWIEVEG